MVFFLLLAGCLHGRPMDHGNMDGYYRRLHDRCEAPATADTRGWRISHYEPGNGPVYTARIDGDLHTVSCRVDSACYVQHVNSLNPQASLQCVDISQCCDLGPSL